jgi:hypothetical protein
MKVVQELCTVATPPPDPLLPLLAEPEEHGIGMTVPST